jgi:hypothetical protein
MTTKRQLIRRPNYQPDSRSGIDKMFKDAYEKGRRFYSRKKTIEQCVDVSPQIEFWIKAGWHDSSMEKSERMYFDKNGTIINQVTKG